MIPKDHFEKIVSKEYKGMPKWRDKLITSHRKNKEAVEAHVRQTEQEYRKAASKNPHAAYEQSRVLREVKPKKD